MGLNLPIGEQGMAGETPRWCDILALGQRAEAVGFDSIWVPDHLVVRTDTADIGVWAAFPLLSALAASTMRVELGPLVACAGFHSPALLAKMADTIDEISGGRFVLGIGAGWHEHEFSAFGFPFDRRVARFEEAIQIVAPLLREGRVDFVGRFVSARECELRPRGPRAGGPPILIAGKQPHMLELTARYGDRWNATYSSTKNSPEGFAELNEKLDAACDVVERDPATLVRTAMVLVRSYAFEVPWEERFASIAGSPEEIAAGLRAFAENGAEQVMVTLEADTLDGIDAMGPVLELLDRG